MKHQFNRLKAIASECGDLVGIMLLDGVSHKCFVLKCTKLIAY